MTFAEQFARSRGKPIEVDGKVVHAIYQREARKGLTMRIRWRKGVEVPVQGVSVGVKGGVLQVAGSRAKDVVLWMDTAPEEVTLTCNGSSVELSLWNCWRDDHGVTQAWVGNSGMIVEELEDGLLRFHCNSRPDITFEDLVFDAVFEEPT